MILFIHYNIMPHCEAQQESLHRLPPKIFKEIRFFKALYNWNDLLWALTLSKNENTELKWKWEWKWETVFQQQPVKMLSDEWENCQQRHQKKQSVHTVLICPSQSHPLPHKQSHCLYAVTNLHIKNEKAARPQLESVQMHTVQDPKRPLLCRHSWFIDFSNSEFSSSDIKRLIIIVLSVSVQFVM